MNKCLFSSKKQDWETPQWLFDELNKEFHFTVDVASNTHNHKCKRYFIENENGLVQDWSKEIVWCNPPYDREISNWVKKASESNTTVVMLLPARTDTKWFHKYIYNKAEVRFLKGRLKFGESKNSAPFPSMIVIFKEEKNENTSNRSTET